MQFLSMPAGKKWPYRFVAEKSLLWLTMQLYQTQVADANAVFALVTAAHTHMGIKNIMHCRPLVMKIQGNWSFVPATSLAKWHLQICGPLSQIHKVE